MSSSIQFKVNCGFARVAIRQFSEIGKGRRHCDLSTEVREQKFKELFSSVPSYGIQNSLFEVLGTRESLFNRHCKAINGIFSKWSSRDKKTKYLETFSPENWKKLSDYNQRRHTLSNFKECALVHTQDQEAFPGPVYQPTQSLARSARILVENNSTTNVPVATTTRQILSELEPLYQKTYGHSFAKSLTNCPHSGVQVKKSDTERKQLKRKLQRECRDHISGQFKENDAISVLAEGQSIAAYKRMRMSQSFETPEQKRERAKAAPSAPRKHSPNFEQVQWDKEGLLQRLRNLPEGERVNSTQLANEFNIPGSNRGQMVKEFAAENSIDTSQLDQRPESTRLRARKLRMPGGEVSVPTHQTAEAIKKDWDEMIINGKLLLGDPCYPQTLINYTLQQGELQRSETTVYGRKIPSLEIRNRLLLKHQPFMHLHSDTEINNMSKPEIIALLTKYQVQLPDELSENCLRSRLKECERTRTIGMWHDHSDILGHGYIFVTMKVFYDPAVFKRNNEIESSYGISNIQAYVEEPELHIIGVCSSSTESQAALITDRLECIKQFSEEIDASNQIKVKDRLMFFSADKPAAQFERGTQRGGNYPCGSCGVHADSMDDFAHCSDLAWRSIQELQAVAIKGKNGRKPGCITPFDDLDKKQIQEELRKRGFFDYGKTKEDAVQALKALLKGVQRVPSLLINNPTQPLSEINLQDYTILDCEPLHDLKGHLGHLLSELPPKVDKSLSADIKEVLQVHLERKETKRGDYRIAIIHLLALLRRKPTPPKVLQLIETAVTISELLYADEINRSPRAVLRFYNATWLHFELCCELFKTTSKTTHRAMFGSYLHAIAIHAPPQYEILCLKSANTEHEERLFGQAKNMVQTTTNRQPNNVIPNILLRLQAKRMKGEMYKSYNETESKVSKEIKELRKSESYTTNTLIAKVFLTGRMSSWQAHLQRIGPFLKPGIGVWWKSTDENYEFLDSNDEPNFKQQGPSLQHYRDTRLEAVYEKKKVVWKSILEQEIILPTPYIKLYNCHGQYVSRRYFEGSQTDTPTLEENDCNSPCHPTSTEEEMDVSPQQTPYTQENGKEMISPTCDDVGTTSARVHLEEIEEEEVINNECPIPLHSKLAMAIAQALGPSDQLKELDKIRHRLKTGSKMTQKSKAKHRTLIRHFRQSLEDEQKRLQQEIKKFEHQYYLRHHQLPCPSDTEYKTLTKSHKFIQKILQSPEFV